MRIDNSAAEIEVESFYWKINRVRINWTRLATSMSNSRTSNKKSPTHSLTINHTTVFVPKIKTKKQNIFIEWVIDLYRIKNWGGQDM